MLTVAEVMERLRVGESAVLGWIAKGELKAVNVGCAPGAKRPRWRISESALAAFEAARTATPPAPRKRRSRNRAADTIEFYA